MRKTKDIKRKRRQASAEYRKGNRKEAFQLWYAAAAEYKALRAPAPAAKPAAPTPPAAS